jgi:hypothetical protein
MSESNEIDLHELNKHLGYDSGTDKDESSFSEKPAPKTSKNSGEKDNAVGLANSRVNLSLTPEQLNEFIKAQKAKEQSQQDTQEKTQENTQQNPSQKTSRKSRNRAKNRR